MMSINMISNISPTAFVLLPLIGYMLGAIPFGLLIGLANGVDIRKHGSGNIGATNLARTLGKKLGYTCFLLDVAKGLLPVLYAGIYLRRSFDLTDTNLLPPTGQLVWLSVAAGCIMGHMFSIYLRFRGGKGVATSFGVAVGLWPYYTVCAAVAIVVWLIVVLIWRYISLASIIASIAFPITLIAAIFIQPDWDIANLWPLLVAAIAICLMVVVRHIDNIKRLISGNENKVFKSS